MKTTRCWMHTFGESTLIKTHDNDRCNVGPDDTMTAGMFVKLSDYRALMRIVRTEYQMFCYNKNARAQGRDCGKCLSCQARKLVKGEK